MENNKNSKLLTMLVLILTVLVLLVGYMCYKMVDQVSILEGQIEEIKNKEENETEDNDEQEDKNEATAQYIDYASNTSLVEDVYGDVLKPENTLKYAVMKEFGEQIVNNAYQFKYVSSLGHEGDSAAWEEIDSNYEGFKRGSTIKIGKYTKIINSELAVINESGMYNDSMTLKEHVTEMYDSIKNVDFYKDDRYILTGMCIMNGDSTSKENYNNNSRVKKIKVIVNNEKEYTFELEDTNKPQVFDMDVKQNDMSKPMSVSIEVLETYNGLNSDDVYITEIGFGLNSGGLGAR